MDWLKLGSTFKFYVNQDKQLESTGETLIAKIESNGAFDINLNAYDNNGVLVFNRLFAPKMIQLAFESKTWIIVE